MEDASHIMPTPKLEGKFSGSFILTDDYLEYSESPRLDRVYANSNLPCMLGVGGINIIKPT